MSAMPYNKQYGSLRSFLSVKTKVGKRKTCPETRVNLAKTKFPHFLMQKIEMNLQDTLTRTKNMLHFCVPIKFPQSRYQIFCGATKYVSFHIHILLNIQHLPN